MCRSFVQFDWSFELLCCVRSVLIVGERKFEKMGGIGETNIY